MIQISYFICSLMELQINFYAQIFTVLTYWHPGMLFSAFAFSALFLCFISPFGSGLFRLRHIFIIFQFNLLSKIQIRFHLIFFQSIFVIFPNFLASIYSKSQCFFQCFLVKIIISNGFKLNLPLYLFQYFQLLRLVIFLNFSLNTLNESKLQTRQLFLCRTFKQETVLITCKNPLGA